MRTLLKLSDWLRHRARLRTWNSAHAWGRRGEDLAHRYLQDQGYTIVARNLQLRGANVEIDMIARDGETIVFVEVKTRASDEFGTPDQAVDHEKRAHLVRAAWDRARFDIVSVTMGPDARSVPVEIRHIKDAFSRPPI